MMNSALHYLIHLSCICLVFAPLLRLSPPPGEQDYYFNLDDSEGICDLFDMPSLQHIKQTKSGLIESS